MKPITRGTMLALALWCLLTATSGAAAQTLRAAAPSAKVPVLLDGQTTLPAGAPLPSGPRYYVLDQAAYARGIVLVFTSPAKRDAYIRAHVRGAADVTPMDTGFGLSLFCWDPNLAGPCFSVAVGSRMDTLGGSDNQVTSVNPAHYGSWTILFEYSYGQGNQFWVQSGLPAFNDLRSYGWSDRASSIEVR